MKVKELKARLVDCPDDAEILLTVNCGPEGMFETTILNEGTGRQKTFILWGDKYQTREVGNAYRANDDRYGGTILLIEVGEESFD